MKDMSAQKQVCSIGTGGEPAEAMRERSWEYGLPPYLQHDLDAYKGGLAEGSSLLDCLWGELYGSINIAEINDGAITHEHANYLRQKFLWVNEVPDFTNCKRVPGRAYNGANGKKIAIEHQGEQYMLKFPPSGQGKRTELSYTNSRILPVLYSTWLESLHKKPSWGPMMWGRESSVPATILPQTEESCLASVPSRISLWILDTAAPERSWRTFWIPLKSSST